MTVTEPHRNAGFGLRIALLLTILPACLTLAGCGVQASTGTAPTQITPAAAATAVPQAYFGMIVHSPNASPTIPYGSQRLGDVAEAWSSLEPQRGVFDFTALDATVDAAQSRGADILLTLGQTPAWASSDLSHTSTYGAGASAPPIDMNDWDAYVSAVLTRYRGRIAAYELWNQPDSTAYWTGSIQQMVELSAHAFTHIKSIDPAAIVVSPSGDQPWLDQYLAAGGGASIDVIGSHLSPTPAPPESQSTITTSLRTTMTTYGLGSKPVWNTENGWSASEDFSSDQAAAYVARALLLSWNNGVSRIYWSSWDGMAGDSLPLATAGALPTAAATAYQQVESWMLGSVLNGCSTNSFATWTCQLNRNGKPAWILWNPDATVQSSTLGASVETDLAGNQQDLAGVSSINVGPQPVLLQ